MPSLPKANAIKALPPEETIQPIKVIILSTSVTERIATYPHRDTYLEAAIIKALKLDKQGHVLFFFFFKSEGGKREEEERSKGNKEEKKKEMKRG